MAPGSSAQKKKKELQARRALRAAEAFRAASTATASMRPEAARDIALVPIPSLDDTNWTKLGDVGHGVDSGDGEGEVCPPISIRTKRGPKKPKVVDMTTGNKVNNPGKRGIVTGTKTAFLKSLNNNQPLKVDYPEEHKGPKELKWRTLMSRDIGSAVRSKVLMLAPTYAELDEEHQDALTTYMEEFYDLPPTETGMWKYINETAGKIYKDWKHDCHTHYVEVSKVMPEEFIHRPELWEYLKAHFEDDGYKVMCSRNAANRNKGKDKGYAINHHSGTTSYSYRVAANEEKGHPTPLLQTVCDVYQPS